MKRALATLVFAAACLAHADYMDHFVQRLDIGPRKAPSLGRSRVLLVPVEVAGFTPFDRAQLEHFFSGEDEDGFVRYYETASLQRYRPEVVVAPTVHYDSCPLPPSFTNCRIARGDITALTAGMDMMRDVVARLDASGFDFAPFDLNGRDGKPDGWIDGIMLLSNTPFGGIGFPFAFFNKGDNLNGGTGGALEVDGVKISHFAIAGSRDHLVQVHEFGHILGLTDLYDESQTYDGLYLSWMGAWGYDEKIPLPDAESRYRLRWARWHQVQGRQTVNIKPAEISGEVYRLGTGDEYFLVENRGPGAFDKSLTERGLAIFHVDRTVKLSGVEGDFVNRLLDCVNCDPWRPYIRLVQADGQYDIENGGSFGEGDLFTTGAAFQGDDARWYSDQPSGMSVTNIKVNADGSIDATLTAPTSGQCGESLCADGEGCRPVTCGVQEEVRPGCAVSPWLLPLLAGLLLEKRVRRRQQRIA